MKALQILIIAGLAAAGIALYLVLTRKKSTAVVAEPTTLTGNEWVISDALQATQLASLAAQLTEKPTKADVLDWINTMIPVAAGVDAYTKTQADDRYVPKTDVYSKSQADDRYVVRDGSKGLSTNDYSNDDRTKLVGLLPHTQVNTYANLAGVSVGDKPVLVTCLVDGKYGETESLYVKSHTKLRKIALIDED